MSDIEYWKPDDLIEYDRNPRNNDHVVDRISSAIKEFGFRVPIIAKSDGLVIDGHLRLKAAKKLKIDKVPVLLADDMTNAQIKAFRLSVNKMAELAEWNEDLLALEMQDLSDMNFDLLLTGFSDDEIDALLESLDDPGDTDAGGEEHDAPEPPAEPISKLGDIWVLGRHRVMCGDSTSMKDVQVLLDGNAAEMVLTDPPYGIKIVGKGGKVGDVENGSGRVASSRLCKSGVYAPIAGDDSIDVAVKAIGVIMALGAKVEIIWGGNYYANHLPNTSCWIVWDKDNGDSYFADAELAWTNQDSAVRIFKHTWNGMIKGSEHGQRRVHPTQKPVALAEWCIENYGEDCETVLDLFGGSGFTMLACENLEKRSFTMELSPNYVDVIVRRYCQQTGLDAVHAVTGEKFPLS